MMTNPLLGLRRVGHAFQNKTVLDADHLDFFPETITGLAGPNGSGKSTLLSILGLILKPSRGSVHFMGEPVGPFSEKARYRIALLTQEPYLLNRSVFDNVAYGLRIRGDKADLEKRVFEALDTVGLSPERFAQRHAHRLSGGEARRVALAARLVLRPNVLLLDEPTSHVDDQSSRMIRSAVLGAQKTLRTTLVVSSHDWDWLDSICDRVVTLLNGRTYDRGRLNLLYGPWTPWTGTLSHGPIAGCDGPLPIPTPPHEQSVAILPVRCLELVRDTALIPREALSFMCYVTGLRQGVKTGMVDISLKHGDNRLIAATASVSPKMFMPGETVFAYYFPRNMIFG